MTTEKLIRLLEDPDLLSSITFEELKTLALAYPYAHNLRYLLAIKAQQEQHPDAERLLSSAAVFSIDRNQLYSLMHSESDSEVSPVLTDAPNMAEEPQNEESSALTEDSEASTAATESQAELTSADQQGHAQVNGFARSFPAWMEQFNLPVLPVKSRKQKKREVEPKAETETGSSSNKRMDPIFLAKQSVKENPDLYSETLARLLAEQGHIERSIEMFEKLRLQNPSKSAYFAAEIDKLKI